jgi:hypothetical protein
VVERTSPFSLRVSEESMEAYRKAAIQAGLSVSEWARLTLDLSAAASRLYVVDVSKLSLKETRELVETLKEELKKGRDVRDGKW